jgi:hypothetical protein
MSWVIISISHVLTNLSAKVSVSHALAKSLCYCKVQPSAIFCILYVGHVPGVCIVYMCTCVLYVYISEFIICFNFYLLTLLPFSVNRSDDRVCDGRVDCMNGEDEDQNLCGIGAHGASSDQILNQQFSALSLPDMDSDHFKARLFIIRSIL